MYFLFRNERLIVNIKVTFHKALIRSVMTYAYLAWELAANTYLFKIAAPTKQGFAHRWKILKVHIGPRFAHGFQPSVCIRLYNKIVQVTDRSRTKS
jgi:hypothetical protein